MAQSVVTYRRDMPSFLAEAEALARIIGLAFGVSRDLKTMPAACPLRAAPASAMEMAREAIQRARERARLAQHALPLCLAMALAFDPHILVLSWSAERQETVAATSRATCEQAAAAIREGRWLADDPPAAMVCRQGSGFSPASLCIQGFNCREGR